MPNFLASWQQSERRDAGAAERTGLENRSRATLPGVQIPLSPPIIQTASPPHVSDTNPIEKIRKIHPRKITPVSNLHYFSNHIFLAVFEFLIRA